MDFKKNQWIVIAGAMFVGMGIGTIFNRVGVGTLIGIGVGLLIFFYLQQQK